MITGIDNQFNETEKAIFNRFPKLFRQANLSMQESCMYWGMDIPLSWFPVVEKLAEDINEIAQDCVEFSQIKEKWHELRVYVDFVGEVSKEVVKKVDSLIDEAEEECLVIYRKRLCRRD